MKIPILALSAVLIISQALCADDLPIMVPDSGSKEVDELVVKLVSHRPNPFPPSGRIPKNFQDKSQLPFASYITNEVERTIRKLESLGPASSPYLLVHLEDDRYSHNITLPSRVGPNSGWFTVSVGMVIRDIVTGGFESSWVYKWRIGSKGAGFPPPQFSDYLQTQGGLKNWVKQNSKNSKAEVFVKFHDWCIGIERQRGFESKEDEKWILTRYEARKTELEQDTDQAAIVPESKPEDKEKPKPEAEGRSQ